jgi:hypothetical protein
MSNHKLFKNVYLEKCFGSSVDNDVVHKPYRVNRMVIGLYLARSGTLNMSGSLTD